MNLVGQVCDWTLEGGVYTRGIGYTEFSRGLQRAADRETHTQHIQ